MALCLFMLFHAELTSCSCFSEWLWSKYKDPSCAPELPRDCHHRICLGRGAIRPDGRCHSVTWPTFKFVWGKSLCRREGTNVVVRVDCGIGGESGWTETGGGSGRNTPSVYSSFLVYYHTHTTIIPIVTTDSVVHSWGTIRFASCLVFLYLHTDVTHLPNWWKFVGTLACT